MRNSTLETEVDSPGIPSGAAVAFGGSALMVFLVAPLSLLAGLAMLASPTTVSGTGEVIRQAVAGVFVLFAIAAWFPRGLPFAGRIVTAVIFLACCGYVVDRIVATARGTIGAQDFGIFDSLQALVAFGLPSLWFTLRRQRPRILSRADESGE